MKQLLTFSALGLLILMGACEKSTYPNSGNTPTGSSYFAGSYECQKNSSNRIGARCKDESLSQSTGSGTCSRHGGVAVWLCK